MNLAQVADELYGLPPAEFVAARDEHARRARAAGDAALAREIMKLRRPTVSAWLMNRLAHEASDQLGQLLELGESLREAQRTLAGDRLRELSGQRRELVGAIVQDAKRLAASSGQALTAQAEREVAATLEAALADPDAARAVQSGQLTRPLSHVGLGDEEMGTVIPFPKAPREPVGRGADHRGIRGAPPGDSPPSRVGGTLSARRPPAGEAQTAQKTGERAGRSAGTARGAVRTEGETARTARGTKGTTRVTRGTTREQASARETAAREREERAAAAERLAREAAEQRRAREAEAAERDLREARAIAQEARAALDEVEQRLAGVRDQRQVARQRADELERLLSEAEAEQTSLTRAVREAQRSRDVAAKWLDTAERRLARAQDRAAKHT